MVWPAFLVALSLSSGSPSPSSPKVSSPPKTSRPVDPAIVPPSGMHRVAPPAPVTIGEGAGARAVAIAPFFVDDAPVSIDAYGACARDGACFPLATAARRDDDHARVDWLSAERYCGWAGKRLPSEAESELALQHLSTSPSASTSATSTMTNAPAPPEAKHAPAAEWTATWFVDPSACPTTTAALPRQSAGAWAKAMCGSVDPLDVCDGAAFCGQLMTRVIKDPAHPSSRAPAAASVAFDGTDAAMGPVRHAFRCVTTTNRLTRSLHVQGPAPLPVPPDPTPPTADEHKAFAAIVEDTLEVPVCDKPGRSYADCRDSRSYLKTNEPRIDVVLPAVENRGGGYTGVASDQNYTFVAHARSQWVWLFDYDANVVRWHHVLRALILDAADRHAFIAFFDAAHTKTALAAIERQAPATERALLTRMFREAGAGLRGYYERQGNAKKYEYTWLGSDERYQYIRTLYQQGRMAAFQGNMLDQGTMKSIGAAARALQTPIRIYYPSNAPEFWPFTDQYRANVQGFPFDERSIVVQTISGISLKTGYGQTGYWHYNVQDGRAQQQALGHVGITRLKQLLFHRTRSDSTELTWTDLPSG